jgi:MarR family 2-MHQ and catechol resistance regulon transcriptional repressor
LPPVKKGGDGMDDNMILDVYYTLKRTSFKVKKDLMNKLAEGGITWPQFHALYHIGEEGISANELAKELNCNASNMTGLIDRMMENNWVYRERCAQDRRIWLIKLTEEGMKLRARLIPEQNRNIINRMSALSEEELVTLKRLLEKLERNDREDT